MNPFRSVAVLSCAVVTFAGPALAAPPAAPMVTTGADIKQLRFDWNYVPQANYYELWFRANAEAAAAKFAETPSWRPRATNNVSAHLLDWPAARYQVKACNPSGCSASPSLSVADRMFESIGYFKGSPSRAGANYGWALDVSEDGNTLAVLAIMEPNASGTNPDGATIYMYVKNAGQWREQAKLRVDPDGYDDDDVASLSLSGDGSVLAVGLPFSLFKPPALGGGTGAVYLFRRNGTTWTQEQRIEHAAGQDFFGYPVKLDEAGDTLLFGHGSNGRGGDDGRAWVYQHGSAGWSRAVELAPPDGFDCQVMTLSGDGNTVARGCQKPNDSNHQLELFGAPAWSRIRTKTYFLDAAVRFADIATDYSASVIATSELPTIRRVDNRRWVRLTYKGDGTYPATAADTFSGPWQQWHEDKYGVTRWGEHLAVSRNAEYIAVTDGTDSGAGYGVLSYPLAKGTRSSGAVFVYERRSSPYYAYGYYGLRRILKPNVPGSTTASLEGADIAFGRAGKTLAVSQPGETSNASGIDGDRTDTSLPSAGAVWLY